jgi:hypothetical protein
LLIRLPIPRHQFIPFSSGPVASDLVNDIGDIGLWFEAIELDTRKNRLFDAGVVLMAA